METYVLLKKGNIGVLYLLRNVILFLDHTVVLFGVGIPRLWRDIRGEGGDDDDDDNTEGSTSIYRGLHIPDPAYLPDKPKHPLRSQTLAKKTLPVSFFLPLWLSFSLITLI